MCEIICLNNLFTSQRPTPGSETISESPLKMMKKAFYFMLKACFVLKIFTFLPRLFGYAEKRLGKKVQVIFKIYVVTNWTTNNYDTRLPNFSRIMQSDNEI